VHFQLDEQLIVIPALGVSIFLGLCGSFCGRRWLFSDYRWCWRGLNSSSPSYKGCPKQNLRFSDGQNRCSTVSPFLHALVLDPPEAFVGNSFTTYGGCGPCFSLSQSDLVHPYCDFFLLGPTDLLPQELGLVIEEFVQGDEVGNYVVQKVFLVAVPFQVSHAGLPNWGSDGGENTSSVWGRGVPRRSDTGSEGLF
jgi:hypothetical protein